MGLFNGGMFKGINKALTKASAINIQGTKMLGSALFPGLGNMLSQQETNEANKKLQDRANQQNIDLWNRQNAYNTPAEQMKRLEAAGLSPQLAYGQVADSKAGSAPDMGAAHYEAPKNTGQGSLEAIAAYQQIVNGQEMNKKMRLDNAYTAYENQYFMKNGIIKGDSPLIKLGGRVGNFVNASSDKLGKSSLWQSLGDLISRMSERNAENSMNNAPAVQHLNIVKRH